MSGCILITGPASSGKSEWAEATAAATGQPVTYVATAIALPNDAEWQAKIARHQQRRPQDWQTAMIPEALPTFLAGERGEERCFLIDSLGTWVANGLALSDPAWEQEAIALLGAISPHRGTLIFVAEEVGWGVVPAYPLGRKFRDRLGQVVRQLSPHCDAVYLVTGGYALNLTQWGIPLAPSLSKNRPGGEPD